jgi:hypothetical protein
MMRAWLLIGRSLHYYYWIRPEEKPVYNCTKDKIPPNTSVGYYRLETLRGMKNDKTEIVSPS